MNYKQTLNLPRTSFPLKAGLLQREADFLQRWATMGLYHRLQEQNTERPSFCLHDGPPYASGEPRLDQILNKILKDFVVRSRTMMGYCCEFVPGWDCHGLPIELEVERRLGEGRQSMSKGEIRQACRQYAREFIEQQREVFQRLGVLARWEEAYQTMSSTYEATITRELARLMRTEGLVRREKAVYWCWSCKTALAEFEVRYGPAPTPSVYVTFPLISDPIVLEPRLRNRDVEVAIWTTMPWTLPAALAVAVDADFSYLAVRYGKKVYLVAEKRLEAMAWDCGWRDGSYEVLLRLKGHELLGMACRHPFIHRKLPILEAPVVSKDSGTGCKHVAPGHGVDDYWLALEERLPIYSPVDEMGRFTAEVPRWQGRHVLQSSPLILEHLQEMEALLNEPTQTVFHAYPHCWRCQQPVIFRATRQWFLPLDQNELRQRALRAVAEVEWKPPWGEERMRALLQNRSDWCLTRQRDWGVPLPIFYCTRCGSPLLDPDLIEKIADRFAEGEGAELWFEWSVEQMLALSQEETIRCETCGNESFHKEEDIVDVWFDSGVSYAAVMEKRFGEPSLADLYLESVEQYRGWFQSSLLTAVQTRQRPPYREVFSHGLVRNEEGKDLSAQGGGSLAGAGAVATEGAGPGEISAAKEAAVAVGEATMVVGEAAVAGELLVAGEERGKGRGSSRNLTYKEVLESWGAEILRLWAASVDVRYDLVFSEESIKQRRDVYRKLRSSFRFLLGNLYDFDPETDWVETAQLEEVDRFALQQLRGLVQRVQRAYEVYAFHRVLGGVMEYCADLRSFYFEVSKDRLYASAPHWPTRRKVQTALYRIVDALNRILAPLLCFTAEEIWEQRPHRGEPSPSVHLSALPRPQDYPLEPALAEKWHLLRKVRTLVSKALERQRAAHLLASSREAQVALYPLNETWEAACKTMEPHEVVLVTQSATCTLAEFALEPPAGAWLSADKGLAVSMEQAPGQPCPRCRKWIATPTSTPGPNLCPRCADALADVEN